MKYLPELFAANARWAGDMLAVDPNFFAGLVGLQDPEYLWIGCSDSRVGGEVEPVIAHAVAAVRSRYTTN